jgi:hypothetical protein
VSGVDLKWILKSISRCIRGPIPSSHNCDCDKYGTPPGEKLPEGEQQDKGTVTFVLTSALGHKQKIYRCGLPKLTGRSRRGDLNVQLEILIRRRR